MDKSLDQMIVDKKNVRRSARRGRGGGASGTLGARSRYASTIPAANVAVKQAAAAASVQAQANGTGINQTTEKILVSNLPIDVNEPQIRELFQTTVGPLKEVNLHHDSHGKSKGLANVTFAKKGDGNKAYKLYNNRLIDGRQPMRIELVFDPSKVPPPPLSQRVTPHVVKDANAMEGVESTVPSAARRKNTRGGRGRGGRKRGEGRPTKTAADLDAEMEDYQTTTTAAAPAAAAAA